MSASIVITAGHDGGDFNQFINHMGNPRDFGLASSGPKRLIFAEGHAGSGQTIVMDRQDGFTRDLRLLAADGHVLTSIHWVTLGFGVQPSNADSTLDRMMDLVQSGLISGSAPRISFVGRDGDDIFTGRQNADLLAGGGGDDVLSGGAGADRIAGGIGNDTIIGGNGADRLIGNSGADVFVFNVALATPGDRIVDFDLIEADKIDLRLMDAVEATVEIDGFSFIGSDAFGQDAGELRLQVGTNGTTVQGDTDGDGQSDFTILLLDVTSLDLSAFLLI